ncbi:MAG TPA: chemotaxis protein CheW [Urbifossiella sp.]|nr:chemotaxis protein CheW [Urbifossiella sp.]
MTPTDDDGRVRGDAAEMRRAFDRLFAAPDPPAAGETEDFVAVRVGGRPFALRVVELARVEVRRKVTTLPGAAPGLLGLVSVRGQIVPAFSLELALGLPATPAAKPWLAVAAGEPPFGLAFDALDGYLRVPRADVLGGDGPGAPAVVRAAGELRPVVSMAAVLAAVRGWGSSPAGGH